MTKGRNNQSEDFPREPCLRGHCTQRLERKGEPNWQAVNDVVPRRVHVHMTHWEWCESADFDFVGPG